MITIELDDEARRALIFALDLYQRVAMGQWRDIAEHAPNVLGDHAAMFGPAGDALIDVRSRFAADPNLRHPNASLGIRRTHRTAQIACDLWHALGGGMASRRNDRLTDAHLEVHGAPA